MTSFLRHLGILALSILSSLATPRAAEAADEIGKLSPEVLGQEQRREATGMIERDILRRTSEANARNRSDWAKIKTREQWERYRDERISRLRRSLGDYPPPPAKLNLRVTGVVAGEGYRIENLVYESRPGQWVPGNLYQPTKPRPSMPGILIAHSHHRAKTQQELQDMGMTWARAGCLVLIIDQVGYGERRSHPFHRNEDYAKPYQTSRQDYYFRYDTGVQLQLLGDSLMGWMVWDLSRGVDLLLTREGVDSKRIILLGAVAAGGDPAAITAALDRRIACCVPFNFGGPQPETRYPLPDDAETSFNYLGGTYWDSSRGLRLSGRDDFFHWVIVASTAPHYLIHSHEFSWDKQRDPVWKRYQKVWGEFYGADENLGFAHGKGTLKLEPPNASHCTNIGKFHRRMIHPLFERWFDIKVGTNDETSAPRKPVELICLTDKAKQDLKPKSLAELLNSEGQRRIEKGRRLLAGKSSAERRQNHREAWAKLLGPVSVAKVPIVKSKSIDDRPTFGVTVERLVLEVEQDVVIPLLVLSPGKPTPKAPVVVCLARTGKAGFLRDRADELRKLVKGGSIVVLLDVRGTGETRTGGSGSQGGIDAELSTHLQLFGETLLGQRLRDVRSVLAYLRGRHDVDAKRIAFWGDAFAALNSAETNFKVPRRAEGWPRESEPLGGLLALLGALFDDEIRAVYVSGGLAGYQSVLGHYAILIPHGDSVPGALTTGDLCDLAGSLAPRPLRLEGMVDHLNRRLPASELEKFYEPAVHSYSSQPRALELGDNRTTVAAWLLDQLR